MLVQFRKYLQNIEAELKRIDNINEVGEEFFTPIRTMAEILEAFQSMEEIDEDFEDEE